MDFELRFEDAFEFAEKLNKAPEIVKEEIVAATDRLVIAGMGHAIPLTPVRTGHLRRSHAKKPTVWTGGGAVGEYGNATPYAPFVEYGTRFMAAQPYMEPSADFVRSQMEREYGAAMQRIARRMGIG